MLALSEQHAERWRERGGKGGGERERDGELVCERFRWLGRGAVTPFVTPLVCACLCLGVQGSVWGVL